MYWRHAKDCASVYQSPPSLYTWPMGLGRWLSSAHVIFWSKRLHVNPLLGTNQGTMLSRQIHGAEPTDALTTAKHGPSPHENLHCCQQLRESSPKSSPRAAKKLPCARALYTDKIEWTRLVAHCAPSHSASLTSPYAPLPASFPVFLAWHPKGEEC